MTEEAPESGTEHVSDSAVGGMVAEIEPEWRVTAIERSPHGTDLVAILDVRTPERQSVVLKATTADFVDPIVARSDPGYSSSSTGKPRSLFQRCSGTVTTTSDILPRSI